MTPPAVRDPRRLAWLAAPATMLAPSLAVALALSTGSRAWYWATPVLLYGLLPLLDLVLGDDATNPAESEIERLEADPWYRSVLGAAVAAQMITFAVGAWAAGTLHLDPIAYAGLALSVGLTSGIVLATAHELGHKKGRGERGLAKLALATGAYGQFLIDHNRGHHRDVATPGDSGTARLGESIYRFALRHVPWSGFVRPWRLEKERLARRGRGPWSLENEMLQALLAALVLDATIILLGGKAEVAFLVTVVVTTYLSLTFADYVEHYGLRRRRLGDGRFERVRPEHAWNADSIASNLIYFHLERHSDHHAWPTRRYQILRTSPELPTLPTGYPGMFVLALLPPLWRRVMDRRVPANDPGRNEAGAVEPDSPPEDTLAFACPACGYVYDERSGDEAQGFRAGTPWSAIPAGWSCPDCSVRDKADFVPIARDSSLPPASGAR